MKKNHSCQNLFFLGFVFLFFSAEIAHAQFMGFGQSGGARSSSSRSSSSSSSSAVTRSYSANGMIGDAIIEADYDTRSIIVITDEETNKNIAEVIKNLDRPVQQVLIKVVFLEVTYRDDKDIGIEGSINASDGGKHGGIFETMFNVAAQSDGGFYKVLNNDLDVTIRAIAEVGKTEVLSRPSVLTRNNQEAVITVGKEVPFITNSRISDTGQTTNTVEYQDIGIILRVTPFITQEGLVEMILNPEISNLTDETVPISDTVKSPVIAKRSADTVVATPNGKTVVIGGMMEDNTISATRKVPILGDIPLLGLAFQRKEDQKTKTELLIFLTPFVVDGPKPLLDLSQAEKNSSTLIPQAFSEEQMNRFFDQDRNTMDSETESGPVNFEIKKIAPGTTQTETQKTETQKSETQKATTPKTESGTKTTTSKKDSAQKPTNAKTSSKKALNSKGRPTQAY